VVAGHSGEAARPFDRLPITGTVQWRRGNRTLIANTSVVGTTLDKGGMEWVSREKLTELRAVHRAPPRLNRLSREVLMQRRKESTEWARGLRMADRRRARIHVADHSVQRYCNA
jgi:hypothetical protein